VTDQRFAAWVRLNDSRVRRQKAPIRWEVWLAEKEARKEARRAQRIAKALADKEVSGLRSSMRAIPVLLSGF
jgi:hypothetical protein